jgi:CheY-like chemotaxis protein
VKLRALVVEDEWATRNYLVEVLQASGAIDVAFVDVELVGSARDDEGLDLVRELEGYGSETELLVGSPTAEQEGLRIPVSRDRAQAVRDVLLGSTMGVRAR